MFKRKEGAISISEYKKTLAISIPVIIAQAGQITVGLADNMMIGHLGCSELAAASFTNTLFNLVVIFGMGFSFGLTPLVGHQMGKRGLRQIGEWVRNGIVANIILGILLVAVLGIISIFMSDMNQPESIVPASREYLYLLMLSVFPMQIFYVFKQFYEGIGNTRVAMNIILISNILNIVGNYVFMYGKLGFPELGLMGAAIGTLIARVFMAVSMIFVFANSKVLRKYYIVFKHSIIKIASVKNLFKIGLPLGGQLVMEASVFGLCSIMMGWFDETSLAAHQIAIALSTIGFMVYQGIGAATTIRVSHFFGDKNIKAIRMVNTVSTHILIVYVVFIMIVFIEGSELLPYLFTNDVNVIKLASSMLVMCAIYQLVDGIQIVLAGALRGIADVKIPALITFIAYFVVALPVSYLSAFTFKVGAIGIWFGFPVGLGIACGLYYYRYRMLLRKSIL